MQPAVVPGMGEEAGRSQRSTASFEWGKPQPDSSHVLLKIGFGNNLVTDGVFRRDPIPCFGGLAIVQLSFTTRTDLPRNAP